MKPVVSVCTLTYNQEKFIEQTVMSILAQETDFDFEIVISDDGSTDATISIIEDIIKNHHKGFLIKFLKHENMGVLPNYVYTFKHCNGKYVAFCEGDDYWTDPNKLQTQYNFLELNPEYSLCFHQVKKIDDKGFISNAPVENIEKTYTLKDLASGPLMYTPSVMMKFEGINIPDWYVESPLFDYPLQMLVARKGNIKYLPINMANYRVGTGLWTSGHGHTNMKKLEKLLGLLTREFAGDDDIYRELERRRKEVSEIVHKHDFYLDLYNGKADLSKISVVTAINLILSKVKSKIFG